VSSETANESSGPGRRRSGPSASILIIDDEPAVGKSLRRTLERAGFTVTISTSGIEGLETFQRSAPDIVITDIMMPKLHGIDVIRGIRERGSTTLIIAISGGGNFGRLRYEPDALTTSAYLLAAQQAGANAILTKPFEREELLTCVTSLLQSRGTGTP
jgi:DNA-binding response OmpR family regulator